MNMCGDWLTVTSRTAGWLTSCTSLAEVDAESFYIGGKSNAKFVRIVSQHLARTNTSPEREERVRPHFAHQCHPAPLQPRRASALAVLFVPAVPAAARPTCQLETVSCTYLSHCLSAGGQRHPGGLRALRARARAGLGVAHRVDGPCDLARKRPAPAHAGHGRRKAVDQAQQACAILKFC